LIVQVPGLSFFAVRINHVVSYWNKWLCGEKRLVGWGVEWGCFSIYGYEYCSQFLYNKTN